MADTKHFDIKITADFADFMKMLMHFATGLVDVFKRRTGQFDLPARFKRDGTIILGKRNHIAVFNDRFPIKAFGKLCQKGLYPPFAVIRDRAKIVTGKGEFFVFCADGPVFFRCTSGLEPFDKLTTAFDDRAVAGGGADSHKGFP